MIHRRTMRRAIVAAALAVAVAPTPGSAFLESTTTEGEMPHDMGGVWLVVSHLQFARLTPTPAASPAAEAGGAGAPGASPQVAAASPEPSPAPRTYNVANLLKIDHLPKSVAQAKREADAKLQQAAVDRAREILDREKGKAVPMQTESGAVEGEPKIVIPVIPALKLPGEGDDLDLFLLDVKLPPEIEQAMAKMQSAEKPWTPSKKDLETLGKSWSKLPKSPPPGEYSKIEWKVASSDKFDQGFQSDPATDGAQVAISANQEMMPKPGVPKQNVLVFGIREFGEGRMEGTHVRAMMASAPFPLPIEMKGTFTMYKIADVPAGETPAAKPASSPAKAAPKKAAEKK